MVKFVGLINVLGCEKFFMWFWDFDDNFLEMGRIGKMLEDGDRKLFLFLKEVDFDSEIKC